MDACEQWLVVAGVPDEEIEPVVQSAIPEVRRAVKRLLESTAAFAALPPVERRRIARDTVKVASFMAQPHDLSRGCTRALSGEQSWWLLQDVDFPAFVGALVQGVFGAIVDASIEQMREYGELVKSVGKTVDAFARDRITDDTARRWLGLQYPHALGLTFVERKRSRLTLLADALARQDPRRPLHARTAFEPRDERELELVHQARRRIAVSRQQLLATMVLLGLDRTRS